MTGQDLITTSIIAMENFLSNNVLFEDTDDVITFINNVKREPHKFNILDYVDEPVSHEELLVYLLNHKKPGQILNQTIVREFVDALDIETTTRIYYKNQILKLLEKGYFKTKLNKILQYTYTDKIAPEMENDLEDLKAKLMEFCLYDYLIEDRYKRSMKDKRKSIITIDTDFLGSIKEKSLMKNSGNCWNCKNKISSHNNGSTTKYRVSDNDNDNDIV